MAVGESRREGPPERGVGRKLVVVVASSLLLVAIVAMACIAAAPDGAVARAVLSTSLPQGSTDALEAQLRRTKEQLSHEAAIISRLKVQEGRFKRTLKQPRTSTLATKGGVVEQQLDGEEPEGGGEADGEADPARMKEELERREEQHFVARQKALANALAHEAEMSPAEARHVKWKAAHEMYEQAAFKDISGEEHNRTEAEPEAEELWTKYEENAAKLDGNEGYNSLLSEANQTDVERMKQWDKYLATQKNRTTLFPLVDKTQGPTPIWPDDNPAEAAEAKAAPNGLKVTKGQSVLHAKTKSAALNTPAVNALSQTLHPGEHVEAIKPFLMKDGKLMPMQAGEKATVLKMDEKTGVDTVITEDGKEGLFPDSDLAPEQVVLKPKTATSGSSLRMSPEEASVSKAASNLHLPPPVKGNVVDVAVREGEQTFADVLAKERARSREAREVRQARAKKAKQEAAGVGISPKKDGASLVDHTVLAKDGKDSVKDVNVVSSAIAEADARFEEAKKREIERSEKARVTRKEMVHTAHEEPSEIEVKQSVSTARAADLPVTAEKAAVSADPDDTSDEMDKEEMSKAINHDTYDGASPAIKAAVAAAEATFQKDLVKQLKKSEHDGAKVVVQHAEASSPARGAVAGKAASYADERRVPKAAAAEDDKDLGNFKESPEIAAAVAAAEATFDNKLGKAAGEAPSVSASGPAASGAGAGEDMQQVSPSLVQARTQIKASLPARKGSAREVKGADGQSNARKVVERGLETHDVVYTEARAREEAKSLQQRTLANKLKMKEIKLAETTARVRALRDTLAHEEDEGKRMLVAKELAEQSKYIGDGIGEEESFSNSAQKGEVARTEQERLAEAKVGMGSEDGKKGAAAAGTAKQERLLMARALQEQAVASKEELQWRAQELRSKEMQDEEQAAVRSANTMYNRHMNPLRDVSKSYDEYENKLKREEDAHSKAESQMRKAAQKKK